jgi:hypothetical protein
MTGTTEIKAPSDLAGQNERTVMRPDVTATAFVEGYHDGSKDPGYVTSTQPGSVVVPDRYSANEVDAVNYKSGYRSAIN